MQLTSTDETDLLMPLYAGVHDQDAWKTFLTRMMRRTGADYASLIFAQGDTPMHLAKEVFAGRNLRQEARQLGLEALYEKDRLPYDRLRPGRVYHTAEFIQGDSQFQEFHDAFIKRLGLDDERIVRIKEQEGTSAWVMLARNSSRFSATDGALLTAVAPHVAIALRSFVLTERQRIRVCASRDGLARAGVGWIVLGRDARIIDVDPNLTSQLQKLQEGDRLIGEKLHVESDRDRHILMQLADEFALNPTATPRTLVLSATMRFHALLVPMVERPGAALSLPVMLAFCRIRHESAYDRKAMLGELYGLSLREAEFALAMSDGMSISEAAIAMGWTEETARSYSKRIYAKLGVRGQAGLVRAIFSSSVHLA